MSRPGRSSLQATFRRCGATSTPRATWPSPQPSGWAPGRALSSDASPCTSPARLADVQATVRSYDPAIRSGSVLLDDGTELPYDGSALLGSGVRFLRSGQRVRIEVVGSGSDARVAFLTIATMPDRRP